MTDSDKTDVKHSLLSNLLALLFGLFVGLLLFLVADITLGILKNRQARVVIRDQDFYKVGIVRDDDLGYRILPDMTIPVTKTEDGEQIYSVVYNTDQAGRRVVPDSAKAGEADKFLAFFGCSFTFGEGVSDEETLPNQVARLMPGYRVYNYGAPGYGPQQMLAMAESGFVRDTIPEPKGIVVYTIFFGHLNRASGRMNSALMQGRHFPYYRVEKDTLVRVGSFDTARPGLHRMMSFINRSGIVRYFNLNFPPLRNKDYELTAKIILEAKHLFSQQFEEIDFYVLMYPAIPQLNHSLDPVFEYFRGQDITVLDYHELPYSREEYALHPQYDMHPTPLLHKIMANLPAEAIENNNP
ncbi:MAG: hypothetical protein BWY09_01904 [Candidatus Hydrogenedentes bacterium ADurb.Bin179]|nr:MAG: hypothetical protein BWY09_01904 [Candidatus Hydrogenedentes bacterium ADurb.Bin179]